MATKRAATPGSWTKGKSGNPTGRRKATTDEIKLREMCRAVATEVFEQVLRIAHKSKSDFARLKAAEILLDRGFGRPRQEIDLKADVDVKVDPREALARALDRIAARTGGGSVADEPEPSGG